MIMINGYTLSDDRKALLKYFGAGLYHIRSREFSEEEREIYRNLLRVDKYDTGKRA